MSKSTNALNAAVIDAHVLRLQARGVVACAIKTLDEGDIESAGNALRASHLVLDRLGHVLDKLERATLRA
jgi:hypothetical protein